MGALVGGTTSGLALKTTSKRHIADIAGNAMDASLKYRPESRARSMAIR
jgi:hypothetical protein